MGSCDPRSNRSIAPIVWLAGVIVVSTAFGGAWTIIVGLMAILGGRSSNANVWILYPTMPTESRWTLLAWVALGIAGTAIQLAVTARTKK